MDNIIMWVWRTELSSLLTKKYSQSHMVYGHTGYNAIILFAKWMLTREKKPVT